MIMPQPLSPSAPLRRSALVAVLVLVLAVPLLAQVEADALFQGFAPTGEFSLEVDGEIVPSAEIFHAERARAYLIISSALPSPTMISLQDTSVQHVHLMKVVRRDDGTVDILADAAMRPIGRYTVTEEAVSFQVGEAQVKLKTKPPLVGLHPREGMIAYNAQYGRDAKRYEPDAAVLDRLRAVRKDVRVRTYFGTWCSVCKRHLPFMIRVDKDLEGGGIAFEYFGLDKPGPGTEPWPDNVKGVPTGIVYVDGKEVGRIERAQWNAPELAIDRLVRGTGP